MHRLRFIDPMELGGSSDGTSGTVFASMELHTRYMTYRRLFLMLLSKYLLSDRALVEIEKENEESGEDVKLEARTTYISILANTVQFATSIIANGLKRSKMGEAGSGADSLFGPSLVEGTAREVQRINGESKHCDAYKRSFKVVLSSFTWEISTLCIRFNSKRNTRYPQ